MIAVQLRISRDIERLNKSLGEGWTDVTTIHAFDVDGDLVNEHEEFQYTTRENALLDLLAHFGYDVEIEETLDNNDEPVEVLIGDET